jgi:hypothetical protein
LGFDLLFVEFPWFIFQPHWYKMAAGSTTTRVASL